MSAQSVAGFINAVATDPELDVIGFGLSATAGEVPSGGSPGGVRPGRRVPIPAAALLRAWARLDHPGGGMVDRPRRRGARHQLRRAALPEGGPARHRARPDPAALPRALQPDVAAVSGPHPPRHRPGCVDPYGVPGHGGRCHGPFPGRRRSGPCHPQRATLAPEHPHRRDETEPPYILAIGTVEPRKGYPDLVAAFDRIAGSIPDVHLKIAGPPGWGDDALAAAIRSGPSRRPDPSHRLGRRQGFAHRRRAICSPTPRSTRASASHRWRRCRSACRWSRNSGGGGPRGGR